MLSKKKTSEIIKDFGLKNPKPAQQGDKNGSRDSSSKPKQPKPKPKS